MVRILVALGSMLVSRARGYAGQARVLGLGCLVEWDVGVQEMLLAWSMVV
jgi:hypothetical protein